METQQVKEMIRRLTDPNQDQPTIEDLAGLEEIITFFRLFAPQPTTSATKSQNI